MLSGFRLSPQQERIWRLEQSADCTPYRIQTAVLLDGELHKQCLIQALADVVERHEILRTTIATPDGASEPVQLVDRPYQPTLYEHDLQQEPLHSQDATLQALLEAELMLPIQLAQAPLVRACLVQFSPVTSVLALTLSAASTDPTGIRILAAEIMRAYGERCGQPGAAVERMQYREVAQRQGSLLTDEDSATGRAYWRDLLHNQGGLGFLGGRLPTENSLPGTTAPRMAAVERQVDPQQVVQLATIARDHGTSVRIAVQACWQSFIGRLTNDEINVIGVAADLRTIEPLAFVPGPLTRYVPVRSPYRDDRAFGDLLHELDGAMQELGAWQEFFAWAQFEREPQGEPLSFPVLFHFEDAEVSGQAAGVAFTSRLTHSCFDRCKLGLAVQPAADGGLRLRFSFDNQLFAPANSNMLAAAFLTYLESATAQPQAELGALAILPDGERRRILEGFNDTAVEYPQDVVLHQLIAEQAARTPEAIAVSFEGQQLTYRQLNARANQLAHGLRRLGAGPDILVGVCMERSLELVVALVGILKAGAAYVPLDPSYPADRLSFMLADTQVPVLLTQERFQPLLPAYAGRVYALDTEWREFAAEPEREPVQLTEPHHLAYVIYTSGSTGKPKGVMVPHAGICNRLFWMQAEYQLTDADRVMQKTPYSFDVSVWEFFWPLLTGARLVVARPGGHQDSDYLVGLTRSEAITTMHFVPSMLQVFVEHPELEQCTSLRRVFCSGEALPFDLPRRFFRRLGAELHNLYGPTEASVDVSYWACERQDNRQFVPIGRPVANTQLYILDGRLEPVPVGAVGELYIGGVQLARGYLSRPEITAERFIQDPFSSQPGATIYRTGDLARYWPDGSIEYLGRTDFQVKIRGLRIELGEIESALNDVAGIRQSAVLAREDVPGDKRLVAYLVAEAGTAPDAAELRQVLKRRLPDYMVPAAFVIMDAFPLTSNGKVDRRALPAPKAEQAAYVAPRTLTEELLAQLWAGVLKLERVSVLDSFFDLGGHSLIATRLISRIRQAFQVELTVRTMLEQPTVASMAQEIERLQQTGRADTAVPLLPVDRAGELPLSFTQQRLWFLDQLDPGNASYNVPFALELTGDLDVAAMEGSLNEIVRRHEALRTTFGEVDGRPVQVIAAELRIPLPVRELPALPEPDVAALITLLAEQEAAAPFDLQQGPLIRASLLRCSADTHILFVTAHHIIADGWSGNLFLNELTTLYTARVDPSWSPAQLYRQVAADGRRPFDLENGPLFRATVFTRTPEEQVLLLSVHHIISDYWSLAYLLDELAVTYAAETTGTSPNLPPLSSTFADFLAWQTKMLSGPQGEQMLGTWENLLTGDLPVLNLPTDRPRPAVQTYNGSTVTFRLDADLVRQLEQFSKQAGVTPYFPLLAAFQLLLHRYTGQADVVIGSPTGGRARPEDDGVVGYFANPVPIRSRLDGSPNFHQFLHQARESALSALTLQDCPLPRLVEHLQPVRDPSRSPLFQTMFAFQRATRLEDEGLSMFMAGAPGTKLNLGGLLMEPYMVPQQEGQFDMSLSVTMANQQLFGGLMYNVDLFDRATAERIVRDFQSLLRAVLTNPEAPVTSLPLMEPDELQQPLATHNVRHPAIR